MGKSRDRQHQQSNQFGKKDEALPGDEQAETGLAGFCLINDKAIAKARGLGLTGDHFYNLKIGALYDGMVHLRYVEGETVDITTTADYFKRIGHKDLDTAWIATIMTQAIVSITQVDDYARIIMEYHAARMAIVDASNLRTRLMDGEDPTTVISEIGSNLIRRVHLGDTESWSTAAEVLEQMDEQYARMAEEGRQWAGLDSGIIELNDFMSGLCPGEFTILAARPNIGKTTLALKLALHVARSGKAVGVFSLEMSKIQCMQRIACIEAKVDLRMFRAGRLSQDEYKRYYQARQELARLQIYFDHTPGITVPDLQARYERLLDGREVPLVVLDYIQLMEGEGEGVQVFTNIAKGLQRFSKIQNIHLLGVSQLSRGPEFRDDRRPRMADLRESGGLEQAAENVWLIHRPGHYEDLVNKLVVREGMKREEVMRYVDLIIAKTKFGPTGHLNLDWVEKYGEFTTPNPSLPTDDDMEF